jgi:hypothetical protein
MNDSTMTGQIEAQALLASMHASKALIAAELLYRSIELAPNVTPEARATFESNRAGIAAMEASAMHWCVKLGMDEDPPANPDPTRLRRDLVRAQEVIDRAISSLDSQIREEMGGAS